MTSGSLAFSLGALVAPNVGEGSSSRSVGGGDCDSEMIRIAIIGVVGPEVQGRTVGDGILLR